MRKKYFLLLIKLFLINKNIHKQRNIWIIKFVYLIAIILLICFILYSFFSNIYKNNLGSLFFSDEIYTCPESVLFNNRPFANLIFL